MSSASQGQGLQALATALALALTGCAGDAPAPAVAVDLILRSGALIDGSGAPSRMADVAVKGGRIHTVGNVDALRAAREIDASGLTVAPGLIDMHGHADAVVLGDRGTQEQLLAGKILQGVTSIVVGNCGLGVAPASTEAAAVLAGLNGWMTPDGIEPGAMTLAGYLDQLERRGVVLNVATLVPHGPVRISAMGLVAGAPSIEQTAAMGRDVVSALDAGAFGLSVGLIYPPGMYSATEELVDLARLVAARDRLFAAHVRGSSETLLQATGELIEIARSSEARVHHSHLEAVGESFWPDVEAVLALEDAARASGLQISHDVFPYTRAATMMSAIFPPWALEGGPAALLERLTDEKTRRRLRHEMEHRTPEWPPWQPGGWPHNLVGAVGWDGILVASVDGEDAEHLAGRSLAEIAAARRIHPLDAVADLMLENEGRVGQLVEQISGRADDEETLLGILRHPSGAVVSDAEDYGRGRPHPAQAGAFVRALRLFREGGLVPLGEALRRMTSLPAQLLRLEDRGMIRPGAHADLVVFDPLSVGDRATWAEPRRTAEGIRWVLINGEIVVEDGRYVGGLAGRVLRASASRSPAVD